MKLSTRYGLVGIGGLASLNFVHWAREARYGGSQLSVYLLGVSPNLLGALTITFVILGILADRELPVDYSMAKRWFAGSAAMSGLGLIAWEFAQLTTRNLVFDFHDIGATLLGLCLAAILFVQITRQLKTN